jgi:hypothetical protein
MRQREPKESRVVEIVTDLDLEIVVVGHGDQKAPNSRLQPPEKLQNSIFNVGTILIRKLERGVWNLFGAWCLVLGTFIRLVLRRRAEEIRVRLERDAEPAD